MTPIEPGDGVAAAVAALRSRIDDTPAVAVVLGSGLGAFADGLDEAAAVPYEEIPDFPRPTVSGHAGRLVFGRIGDVPVVAMQGRLHLYEGISAEAVTFGVRVFAALGVPILLLTTASGGVNRHYVPGDIMVIEDQLNLQMTLPAVAAVGRSATPGVWRRSGPVYDRELVRRARAVARDLGLHNVHQGVFAGMLGPTYETPSEVRMAAALGADAISMSTVLEATTAHALGMRVIGISAIVNPAAGMSDGPLNHEEVLEGARRMQGRLLRYLEQLVPEIAS